MMWGLFKKKQKDVDLDIYERRYNESEQLYLLCESMSEFGHMDITFYPVAFVPFSHIDKGIKFNVSDDAHLICDYKCDQGIVRQKKFYYRELKRILKK